MQYVAVFSYTIQLVTIKLCTKSQNPNPSSCCGILDGKKFTNKRTDRQTNIITEKAKTIYPLYTSYRVYKKKRNVCSFKIVSAFYDIKFVKPSHHWKFDQMITNSSKYQDLSKTKHENIHVIPA